MNSLMRESYEAYTSLCETLNNDTSAPEQHAELVQQFSKYAISFRRFLQITEELELSEEARKRLAKATILEKLVYPHIPDDDLRLGALWVVLVEPKLAQSVELPASTTMRALDVLFTDDRAKRLEGLNHPCVLVRTASILGRDYGDELNGFLKREQRVAERIRRRSIKDGTALIDPRASQYEPVQKAFDYFTTETGELTHWVIRLPTTCHPIYKSSSECKCTSEALGNLLLERCMSTPWPPEYLLDDLAPIWSMSWSTHQRDSRKSLLRTDFFTFKIKERSPEPTRFHFSFGSAALLIEVELEEEWPHSEDTEWVDLWNDHIWSIEELIELSATRQGQEKYPLQGGVRRNYIWQFTQVSRGASEKEPFMNVVSVLDSATNEYVSYEFEHFRESYEFIRQGLATDN